MQFFQQNFTNVNSYLPAVLRDNKTGWYIEYYCENPKTKKLQRKTVKMNLVVKRFKTKKEARIHINNIVASLNIKLAGGWNPFFEQEDKRLYSDINDVVALFLQEKDKELRPNTMRTYRSVCSVFINWINDYHTGIYSGMVNQSVASRFMDYVYNARNVGKVAYNNYLKTLRALCNWAVEKCYIKDNPFNKLKVKSKDKKTRTIIPVECRKKIITHLEKRNNNFILVCKLMYYSLLRPNEIRQIRIADINVDKHYIAIKSEVAKNHNARFAALTPDVCSLLKSLNLEKYPKNYFLFTTTFMPGVTMCSNTRFGKEWVKIRNSCKLPKEMQLYSFRDTGIFEMMKIGNIDDLSVMQHADHHSLNITTIYANHYDSNLIKTIYEKAPQF
jgi:integrase